MNEYNIYDEEGNYLRTEWLESADVNHYIIHFNYRLEAVER